MRQKLGADNLENISKSNFSQPSDTNLINADSSVVVDSRNIHITEKKSRPPKMRLKKYLEVDTEVCQKRLRDNHLMVGDKRRKLDLDISHDVRSRLSIFHDFISRIYLLTLKSFPIPLLLRIRLLSVV